MTDRHCPICQGCGWVCAAHPDRPTYMLVDGGCDCGAEARACACNPERCLELVVVYAINDSGSAKNSSQGRGAKQKPAPQAQTPLEPDSATATAADQPAPARRRRSRPGHA